MVSTRGKSKTANPNKTFESNEVAGNAEAQGQASHSLMGNTRGKNKTVSPDKASEANEVAGNAEAQDQASHSLMGNTTGKNKTVSPDKVSEANEVAQNEEAEGNAPHSLMENTRGKNKTVSPDKASEANEVAENEDAEGKACHSLTENVEELNGDGQFEDKVEIPVEETGAEESVKATEVENDDGDLKMDTGNKAGLEQNTSEDDDLDDEEDQMWEDDEQPSEEDDEESLPDEDGVSDEDTMKGGNVDEFSAEEEGDDKDAVNIDKTTEVAKADETKAKATEDGGKAKATEDGGKAKPTEIGKKVKAKEDGREAKPKEDRKEAKEHDSLKVEGSLKNDKNSNKKNRKKNVGPKKVDSRDKPESSQNNKGKRVDSMGMIFICNSKTRDDCFQYKVFGLPESKKDIVEKIYSGMRMFLYDVDLKLMHGIFKAAGPGAYNIEPKAFKSQFPSQVRFAVLDDCLPLPEDKFKIVIKENYYSKHKFDCQLKAEQVKQLCKLFVTSSKDHLPKKVRGPRKGQKAENANPLGPKTSRRQRVGDKRHPALEEEPRFHERPRKRPRKVITSPRRQPLPAHVPSYAYERTSNVDAYNRRDQYSYRDRRDLSPVTRRDYYRDVLDPSSVIRRDPYLKRDSSYRDGRDLYVERRDPYRDDRDTYARRHPDPYIEGVASYLERRDPDIGIHSSYRDGRASYLERRDTYRDPAYSVPYRRDPPLSDARDIYREDQGAEYRSSLRREEASERGGLRPLTLETRYRPDIGSRDSYASTRQLPSYADPIYYAEYPSRAGLAREYRL